MDRVRRGEHDLTGLPDDLADILEAALDPDPLRRPDLETILDWLEDPDEMGEAEPEPIWRRGDEGDEFTVPLALAAAGRTPTEALDLDRGDADPGRPDDGRTRVLDPYGESLVAPPPPKPPVGERMRRGLLIALAGAAATAGLTTVPYLALAVLLVLVWLLRSGSLAASAVADRRRLRGLKWYDAPQLLLASPWHVLQAVPGALILALWSAGLATAAALVCYAAQASAQVTLLASGLTFVVSLWLGPGGSRLRGPVHRVVDPVAHTSGSWLAAVVLVAAAAGALLVLAGGDVDWRPFGQPFG